MAVAVAAALGVAGCSSSTAKTAHSATSKAAPTTAPTATSTTAAAATSSTSSTSTTVHATTTSNTVHVTTTTAPPRTVTAGSSDNGRTIDLHVGDTLEVVLSGCGGCGYQWEMTGQPSPVVFRYEGESTTTPTSSTAPGAAPIVGSPVTYTWTFKALSAHSTGFVAGYYPPSQKQPTQTYTLHLVVSS
ncbi:MAG: protease inhibitor I42 family protein [Acidimicrobiales bacterium]